MNCSDTSSALPGRRWTLVALLLLTACSKSRCSGEGSGSPGEQRVSPREQSVPQPYRFPVKQRPQRPVGMEPLLNDSFYWRVLITWGPSISIPERKALVSNLVRKHLPSYEVLPESTRESSTAPTLNSVEIYDWDTVMEIPVPCAAAPCNAPAREARQPYTDLEIYGDTQDFGRTLHALMRLVWDLRGLPGSPRVETPVNDDLLVETAWSGDRPNVSVAYRPPIEEKRDPRAERLGYASEGTRGGTRVAEVTVEEALALPDFKPDWRASFNEIPAGLALALAQRVLENPLPDAPGELVVDIDALGNPQARDRIRQQVGFGAAAKGKVKFLVSEGYSIQNRRTLVLGFADKELGLCGFYECDAEGKLKIP